MITFNEESSGCFLAAQCTAEIILIRLGAKDNYVKERWQKVNRDKNYICSQLTISSFDYFHSRNPPVKGHLRAGVVAYPSGFSKKATLNL